MERGIGDGAYEAVLKIENDLVECFQWPAVLIKILSEILVSHLDHVEKSINRIIDAGLTYGEAFDEIEEFRSEVSVPCCIIGFQIPYELSLEQRDVIRKSAASKTLHFRFRTASLLVGEDLSKRCVRGASGIDTSNRPIPLTQCFAAMPLWGRFLEFYETYTGLLGLGNHSAVVIPRDQKPYSYNLTGAITVGAYEHYISVRTLEEARSAIARFIRDYIAVSMHLVPVPKKLPSLFASPTDDRYFMFGKAVDPLYSIISEPTRKPLMKASASALKSASQTTLRQFTAFENQVLILKQLSDREEPELAFSGLMSLLEWLLKSYIPPQKRIKGNSSRSINFTDLLKLVFKYYDVPEDLKQKLFAAKEHRNNSVHNRRNFGDYTYYPTLQKERATEAEKAAFNKAAKSSIEIFQFLNRLPPEVSEHVLSMSD